VITFLAIASPAAPAADFDVAAIEHDRVVKAADSFLVEAPVTVTASHCPRSTGGLHDFYSEGDYWWPNPADPAGPYVQRDGMTNPDNFVEHRRAMVRMSIHVATLTAAWRLTRDRKYAGHAIDHLRAWFVDPTTRMNPTSNSPRRSRASAPAAASASSTPSTSSKSRAPPNCFSKTTCSPARISRQRASGSPITSPG